MVNWASNPDGPTVVGPTYKRRHLMKDNAQLFADRVETAIRTCTQAGPVAQSEALEMTSMVFATAAELTTHNMMDGEPLELREAIEAALYDLRPTDEEQRVLWAMASTLVDILDGFHAVKSVAA